MKEWEGEGRIKRHTPSLEQVEVEEIEKRLDLQEHYPLTQRDAVVKSRMRRGDHIQRALELIGLKKKKEKLCHHIPHKHCVMVSSNVRFPGAQTKFFHGRSLLKSAIMWRNAGKNPRKNAGR